MSVVLLFVLLTMLCMFLTVEQYIYIQNASYVDGMDLMWLYLLPLAALLSTVSAIMVYL